MIRLPLLLAGGVAAAAAAVTPAIVGLANNSSFSEQLPVRVPAHASVAKFQPMARSAVRSRSTAREREPSDDRNLHGERESREDRVHTPTKPVSSRHEPERGEHRVGANKTSVVARDGATERRDQRGGEADERNRRGGHSGDDRG